MSELVQYKDWAPTNYDRKGVALSERSDWVVLPVIKTRDSYCLEISNFQMALEMMGGEQEDLVEMHSFNHWGCGWFDIILVHPTLYQQALKIAQKLENYLVLNEDNYSSVCYEAAYDYWSTATLKERVEMCKKHNLSIFSARRAEEPPVQILEEFH